MDNNFNEIWPYLVVVNAIISIILIILERKKPEKTIAWLLVFVMLPPVGIILYIFLGRNWKKHTLSNENTRILEKLSQFDLDKIGCSEYESLINLLAKNSSSPLFTCNEIEIFNNGRDKFDALKKEIKNAKKHIHLEYYIVKNDTIGNEIKDLLIQKALEGIKVKFILDRVGSIRLKRRYIRDMMDAGIDVVHYSYLLAPLLRTINTQINYRNHRKIAVIDGKTGFIGGINIGDEYLGKSKFGFWRDTHLMIRGDFVGGLQQVFLDDFCTIKRINERNFFCSGEPSEFFPQTHICKGSAMQLIKSGPDSEHSSIMQGILKMITIAKNHIYITTPYFVPPESLMEALKVAALSGIDVRILFPGRFDHITVYYASRTYLAELIRCGVKIYTYRNDAFIHSKVITVDSMISTVGTANMDIRSFELNYEINAVIYDPKVTQKLEKLFEDDIKDSMQITQSQFENSSKGVKCLEALARVFSSLL